MGKIKTGCLGIVGLFVLLGVIGAVVGGGDSGKTADKPASVTATQEAAPNVKTYKAGQYKVGTDIPAGEYVVLSKGDGYVEVAQDSSGKLESIVVNDIFSNRSIISVSDGEYFKVQNGTIYASADAPKVEATDGVLPAGMYQIGKDLPAGEYKVISKNDGSYIEVSAASTHTMADIVSNDIFTGERYITVQDGQYLKLYGAELKTN